MRFQYAIRRNDPVQEQRDRELEDYLATIGQINDYDADPKFGSSTTNLTLNRAEYWNVGDGLVAGYVDVELAGAPGAGAFSIAMPFAEKADHNTGQTIGHAMLIDQNTLRALYPVYASADDDRAYINLGWGVLSNVTNTNPFTFASTDGITINFQYRTSTP